MKNLQKKQHRQIGAQKQTVNKKQKKNDMDREKRTDRVRIRLDWHR